MPSFAKYNISLCDRQGQKLGPLLPGPDFVEMSWQHALNDAGVYRLTLVAETATKDDFLVDYGVLVERDWGGGMYEEFYGFHLDEEEWLESDEVDKHWWASMGWSPEWILDQPLLQPMVNAGNANWARYDTWWMHGAADDVAKAMASESCGPGVASVESERAFSYLTVEGDESQGAFDCYDDKYQRLLDAMREVVGEDGSRGGCDFRVVRTGSGFELRTYAPFFGTDRRKGTAQPTIFSLDRGNMRNPVRRVIRHAEVTVAYGGWQGGGMERTIYERTNDAALVESPWRRREAFYDVRDVSTPDAIPGWLDQKLVDDGKKEEVEFTPVQTAACLYGRDWWLGDLCTAELWGGEYDVRITQAAGRLDGDNEETIEGLAESWTRD